MRKLIQCAAIVVAACAITTHAHDHHTEGGVVRLVVQPQRLAPDSVVVRQGATGDLHQYTVELEIGTFLELTVSQEAAELRVTVMSPEGAEARSINLPSLAPLAERLLFIASRAGTHRIDVSLNEKDDDSLNHQYTLRVIALRPASDRDSRRDRCFDTTARADRLARSGQAISDLANAIELLKSAANCWQTESDVDMEAAALSTLGALSGMFSEFRLDSAAALERLIAILRATGQTNLELLILDDLIVEYNDDGRFDRSRERAIEMQRLAARLGQRQREGRAYQRIADAEFSLGNYESARRAAMSALDVANELQNAALLATAYWLLGRIDEVAGDYDAALGRYEQGLRAAPADRFVTPNLRNALGFLRLRRGEHEEAARQFEARLAMSGQYVQRDTEALARVGLGDVRLARGDRDGARQMYVAAAEALRRGIPTLRCIAIQRLARQALNDGLLDEAFAQFSEMLAINQQMRNPPCEAEAQAGIADVAMTRGDLAAADTAAREVIQIAEQFREAAPNLESRALGFGALAPAFDRAVEISMRLAERGDSAAASRALLLNERALARGLLDRISARLASDALASDRQRVREQWRVRVAQYQVAAHSTADRDRAETLQQEMTALELQLRDLEARGDAADARRARFIRPQTLQLDAIQALLDEDTTLLEYALGERQSYLWVVSSRDMRAFRLAPRVEIESAAGAVYRDLTTPASAGQPGAEERRRALSRLVLAPAASLLTGRRLVIVSAGALSLVPFAALPMEREPGNQSTLLSRFEIVHAPSAATLAGMRALTERRARPGKHTVVFADPIFETADPRASARPAPKATLPAQSGSRSAEDAQSLEGVAARTAMALGASFPRLPFSRAEANALSTLAPGQVTAFMDGLATRDRALGEALADYRFIHFATHGIVRPDVPNLSSIVLSFVDGSGKTRDPFLTLPDIYEMRLNADVVVLSACSTAEGRNVPGEGPIGLARAFMYAGAPRVIASLWRVNDIATAELMKRFYRGMLVEKLPAAAALRAAQQQVAAIPRWSSPYYWAPFVLQGDWR
jgi:CHAT domain-containing protein/tetratricopeptide (TPR) repeat protein